MSENIRKASCSIIRRCILTTAAVLLITALFISPAVSEETTPEAPGGGWTADNYLTFSSDNQFTLKTENTNDNWDGVLYYSTDAETWTKWNGAEISSSLDGKLYLLGTGNTYITGDDDDTSRSFVLTSPSDGLISCTGNIENLLNYTKVVNNEHPEMADYCFAYLFIGCTNLKTAPDLTATVLADKCYYYMFAGCTSLTTAPDLSATVLADSCYYYMFSGCTSLTTVPELSETDLEKHCYKGMFSDCTGLTVLPANLLPAGELKESCYESMFSGCTGLTAVPDLPAQNVAFACYKNMFNGCIGLTTLPDNLLPATDLSDKNYEKGALYCYQGMFEGCTSLTTVPDLPAIELKKGCYEAMFAGCTSLTTVPALEATTLAERCYQQMFQGCTSLYLGTSGTEEWKISATKTATNWNTNMFNGCMGDVNAPSIGVTYYLCPEPSSMTIYTISFEGEGYTVQNKPSNINSGGTKTFTIVPKTCKEIISISATNSTLSPTESGGEWTCILSVATDTVRITVTTEDKHAYSIDTYTWSADNSVCRAQQQCLCREGTSGLTESGTVTAECIQLKSCSDDEFTKYTAKFNNAAFTQQTKTVKTAEKGHIYSEPAYEWAADNSTCTAMRVCSIHPEQKETETAPATSIITQQQSCENDELTRYTTTFTNAAFTEQTKEVKTADKTGHTYGDLIPQKDATRTETGLKEHYLCDVCGTYFDADKVKTTKDALTIPKLQDDTTPKGSSVWLTETPTPTPSETPTENPTDTPTPTEPSSGDDNDGSIPPAAFIGGGLAVLIIAGLLAFAVLRRK